MKETYIWYIYISKWCYIYTRKPKDEILRMEKGWLITIVVGIFLVLNLLFYKALNSYYKNEFGKKMWKYGGIKVFFWQGSIFASAVGAALIMSLLKWIDVISF